MDDRYGSTYRLRALARLLEASGFDVTMSEHPGTPWEKLKTALGASVSEYDLLLTEKFNPITLAAMISARLRRRPVVVDWDDFDPGLQGTRIKSWISSFCELLGPRLAHVLTMHSDPIEQRGRKTGRPCFRVPQGFDSGLFRPAPELRPIARRRFGLPKDGPVVGHLCTFTHGGLLDIETVLDAWASTRRNMIRFLLIGGGPQEKQVHDAVNSRGLGSLVTFTRLLPHDQVPLALAGLDVSVVFMRDIEANRSRVSFKVIESLAMGVPVVGTIVGETHRLLADHVVAADETTLPETLEKVLLAPHPVDTGKIRELFDWERAAAPLQAAVRLAVSGR